MLLDKELLYDEEFDDEDEEDSNSDSKSTSKSTKTNLFQYYLEGQTKRQLIEMIEAFAREYPLIRQHLEDQCNFSEGKVASLIKTIHKEIVKLSQTPGWHNHWDHEGFTPDYSRVRKLLAQLVESGHADEVVALGKEMLAAGEEQVETSNDNGETAEEITACLEIIFEALLQSTLPVVERMLWAIEAELNDQYGLCNGLSIFWKQEFSTTDWEKLVLKMKDQLTEFAESKSDDSKNHACYQRDRLTDWLVLALEKTGKIDEAIAICEHEAETTDSFSRLVQILVEQKRFQKAKQWILKGIEKTEDIHPGIARDLWNFRKQICYLEKDLIGMATLLAEEFFAEASLLVYQELQKVAEEISLWSEIQANVLWFLETGELPWNRIKAKPTCPDWPLPETGLPRLASRSRQTFPKIETLIDIAIAEKSPERVVLWLDRRQPDRGWDRYSQPKNDQIANAIVTDYPERAIELWKNIAERFIKITGTSAYEDAAQYLRKIRHTLNQLNRKDEWLDYLTQLRFTHKMKRRLIEILGRFSDQPIVKNQTKNQEKLNLNLDN